MKKTFFLLIFLIFYFTFFSYGFDWKAGQNQRLVCSNSEEPVVKTALEMYSQDYEKVFDGKVIVDEVNGDIYVGTVGKNSQAEKMLDKNQVKTFSEKKEGFIVAVKGKNLVVLGSDKRGTAYGILELSRIIGVSPWEWWADSKPEKRKKVSLKKDFMTIQSPSVAYRGIFINDEDWGMMPWSSLNYEKTDVKGRIGPKTHARIFELLLRLRANTFWPAMHECSEAFYLTPGNKEMADKYAISVGTSHCEPMLRNTNGEWKIAGEGSYDYVHNRDNVVSFWEQRVKETAGSKGIYTLGIRGVHDSQMLGAKTVEEQKNAITHIFVDQRNLIKQYVNPDVEQVPQVFIPYKEVLDVYNAGLKVPDDVTLMWTDDNYGYIRHFPNEKERARRGGNGIYYHVSYWGRPHDYLWLSTTHPALIYTQMKMAYDKGVRDIWILNVGDLKPAEYNIELFMDMAWNINAVENSEAGLNKHISGWFAREFGKKQAKELLKIKNEYDRLAFIRKPEFMGNTRTEEKDPAYNVLKDLPWSENEVNKRLQEYIKLEKRLDVVSRQIPAEKFNAWFQLVEYPVRGAAEMNKKHLYAQLARHGKADWKMSDDAYQVIADLTKTYNSLNGGKWNLIMDAQPRKLPVFGMVPRSEVSSPLKATEIPLFLFNGADYKNFTGTKPIGYGLGYARKAVTIPKNSSISYVFTTSGLDSVWIETSLVPNLPVEGNAIRYGISVDGEPVKAIDYKTVGRSEEWKENVLTNHAVRITGHKLSGSGRHTVKITALDEGVMVDQVKIWNKKKHIAR
ncbi:MAG: glycosyl hydrolase 115 family protein [Paludibacteraceae bacterium]